MIVDKVKVYLRAGKGGDGSGAYQRKGKFKKVGYGGNGGRGASIFLGVSPHLYDLKKLKDKKEIKAPNGVNGMDRSRSGKDAQDLWIKVPRGTLVYSQEGELINDLISDSSPICLARGGEGGRGNRYGVIATSGVPGESSQVILDYRIPNDVALLGPPNSGKTTLFNLLTDNRSRVAGYPFTTIDCAWGPFVDKDRKIYIMDTPPLIGESANKGKGVGARFLRHLYRSKLLFLISDSYDYRQQHWDMLIQEVKEYDRSLLKGKKIFHLLTKADKINKNISSSQLLTVSAKDSASLINLKHFIAENVS